MSFKCETFPNTIARTTATFISSDTPSDISSDNISSDTPSDISSDTPSTISSVTPSAPGSNQSSSFIVYAGAVGAGFLVLASIVIAIFVVRRRSTAKKISQLENNNAFRQTSMQTGMPLTQMETNLYPTSMAMSQYGTISANSSIPNSGISYTMPLYGPTSYQQASNASTHTTVGIRSMNGQGPTTIPIMNSSQQSVTSLMRPQIYGLGMTSSSGLQSLASSNVQGSSQMIVEDRY